MKSLEAIKEVQNNNLKILSKERWLMFLYFQSEDNVNIERISSIKELENNYLLEYVKRTLEILDKIEMDDYSKKIVEDVLKWSETAKGGMKHHREEWMKKGYNLFLHNLGSDKIYYEETEESDENRKRIVGTLIATHGLIGQYIRGEAIFEENILIYRLIEDGLIRADVMKRLLSAMNRAIIGALSGDVLSSIEEKIDFCIEHIVRGDFSIEYTLKERLKALRKTSGVNGENFEESYKKICESGFDIDALKDVILEGDLWYVEAALYDFSLEEFIKIFCLIAHFSENRVKHISFERLMKSIYYDYEGKKKVNIYKKRIVEKYLSSMTLHDAVEGHTPDNIHVKLSISREKLLDDTIFINFDFSNAGEKLIEFCIEAEKSGIVYEKAIVLLFDLFQLRKDKYDRFNEEASYLATMNQSIDYKKIILEYLTGKVIVDIGPGGGAIMDLIEQRFGDTNIIGVDISQNVVDALNKKKNMENKRWNVIYGDALNLTDYLGAESVDTIIFCSIIHEMYSYIEFDGKKFNYDTIAAALKSTFKVLRSKGRIIIRDGIMTEPEDQERIIKFLSNDGMEFLKRYTTDFKGREIKYSVVGHNEVMMKVNDAMEFLYTYTWGEKSYVHEVNEQFGYFTPSGYKKFIKENLGEHAEVIECRNYLQEGYEIALSGKIEIFDEKRNRVNLPDSTCLIVIEKR